MTQNTEYADLTRQFRASEAKLGDEGFVTEVMRPIHRRMRLRRAILFGAGGVGAGAAGTQVLQFVSDRWTDIGLNIGPMIAAASPDQWQNAILSNPLIVAGLSVCVLSLIITTALERT